MTKEFIAEQFKKLQSSIILQIEEADGQGKFTTDTWERSEGGGGITRLIENGLLLEKAGVNFSCVYGPMSEQVSEMMHVQSGNFFATGVSIVFHPRNPFVPIIHMNVRYFEMCNGEYWFGGGIDLTPHYVDIEQAKYFHQQLKNVCDQHDVNYYAKFKEWADNYFYIPHRNETRGIGGIFFDRLNEKNTNKSKEEIHAFIMDIGNLFAPLYTHLMKANSVKLYDEKNKRWQLLRRGRYVEFNLIYDKGTRFGLETGGRIESILMSLPQVASWEYDVQVESGSQEEFTLKNLKKGINRI